MHRIAELRVPDQNGSFRSFSLSASPLSVGRGPNNDLVVPNDHVSWNHAMLWADEDGVWLKDLGSSNGSFVNGERVHGQVALAEGDTLRLGPQFELTVAMRSVSRTPHSQARAYVVEVPSLSLRLPVRGERFRIGSSPSCHLRIDKLAPVAGTLLFLPDGEVQLGVGDQARDITLGEPFSVSELELRVLEVDATRAPTIDASHEQHTYVLVATLNGPTGAAASVRDPNRDQSYQVDAANRATLLYLLGRQLERDTQAGLPEEDRGWCSDEDIKVGIWGRAKAAGNPGGLHVLVHRLRREVLAAGLDPWFIEKRRRFIRVRVARVELS